MLFHPTYVVHRSGDSPAFTSTASPTGLTPTQIRHAYGFDQITFGSVQGDGTGQTIAVIDAYDSPTITSDLHAFDAYWTAHGYNLPDPPSFIRVAQDGSTNFPSTDPAGAGNPNGTWEVETALDVEWAHALAPKASILLVEANSPSSFDLLSSAVNYARSQPGVVAISMSFGSSETTSDPSLNSLFTTPSGHSGITFLSSTGDNGQPAGYPAYSPNVVAVGGTTLSVDSSGNYLGESGWSGSGGGISSVESQPAYQTSAASPFSTTRRTAPDISFDADPNSGVPLYDSWDFGTSTPWLQVGGTSFSSPAWAALIAIADQGRVAAGETTLDGLSQTLPKLYSMSNGDFHDITTGNNGFAAGPGYDLVTGIGTPKAALVVNDLIGGFTVASSTPANGATVSTPPTDFTIVFAAPYATSSVAAGDLIVNGIAANSFTLTNSTTVTFHYNASPAATQGLETMSIAAGAVSRQADNAPLAAFNATFRYDAVPITVTATTPASGSTVVLPLTTLSVHFNEAYAGSSIGTSNLSLSQGSVSSFSLIDSQTVAYNLSGVTSPGTFTFGMAAGAVTDAFGNPGPAYSGSLTLNKAPMPFPTPLSAVSPAGSLIYQNSTSGTIAAGSTDTYTLSLAAGQTLTILITPSGGLQAQLGVSGPGVSSSAASASAGAMAALQSVAVTTAGTYTFSVSGLSGTTGSYTIQVDLNTALSTATSGGAGNHTLASGQNIDSSFVALGSSAQRGAATGTLAGSIGPDGFGYSAISITPQFVDISPTGPSPTPNAPLLVGVDDGYARLRSSNLNGFQFKLYSSTYNTIYVSSNGLLTFGSGNFSYTNTDLTSSPSQAAISALWSDLVVKGDFNSGVYWQVLGSGSSQRLIVQWNDVAFYNGNPLGLITFEAILNANGTIIFNYKDLDSGDYGSGGASATVGIKDAGTQGTSRLLVSYNSASGPFVGTGTSLEIGVGLATTAIDYYAFSLAAGQTTTLAVAGQTSAVAVTLENSGGAVLANGVSPGIGSNVNAAINNFVAPATGTYYAVVSGPSGASYSLVVGRGADFDTEVNGSFATAQNISGTSGVLGAILVSPATPTENWYAINLTAGNQLFLQATTLGSTTSQFPDSLVPQIQLYSPNGTLIATGQGTASQSLTAVAAASGLYRVRVFGANSTSGEYFLSAAIDPSPPTASIVAVTPNPTTTPVSQIQIQFNKPVSGVTLANLSLSANGGPNLLTPAQTLTTSDNITYTLGNLAPLTSRDGTYTLSLAASANITDSAGGYLTSGASTTFVVNAPELVTTAADSGVGALRQALIDIAGSPGLTHTIQFALPAGQQTIGPLSPLPTTSDPLILSLGSTQNVTIASTTAWSNTAGLTLTGGGSFTDLGGVSGAGTLTVNAPTHFTTASVIQGALTIGGSAGSRATVTIAATDSSGHPLTSAAVSPVGANALAALAGGTQSDSKAASADVLSDGQNSPQNDSKSADSLISQQSGAPSQFAPPSMVSRTVSDEVVVPKLALTDGALSAASRVGADALSPASELANVTVASAPAHNSASSRWNIGGPTSFQFADQLSIAAIEPPDSTSVLDQVLGECKLDTNVDDGLLDLLSSGLRLH